MQARSSFKTKCAHQRNLFAKISDETRMDGAGLQGTVRLKESPLVRLIHDLSTRFPSVDPETIDRIAIQSKCSLDTAISSVEELFSKPSRAPGHGRADSVSDWIDRLEIVSSKPTAEMKVYHLDV
jgi:hypothetical protein